MEVIPSFTIDHTHLKPGIYVSREDSDFITFDIRITEPNKEPAISPDAMHSIEHLMATWFRNSEVKDGVVYVGPMGCLTGLYCILKSSSRSYSVFDVRDLVLRFIDWALNQEEVPATTPETCGNYLLHDFSMAKWELRRYKIRLLKEFNHEYTKLDIVLKNGMHFADA